SIDGKPQQARLRGGKGRRCRSTHPVISDRASSRLRTNAPHVDLACTLRNRPHDCRKFERDSTSTDSPLTSKVALYILHAAFPFTTLTAPVLNRGMDRCAHIEQCDERKQGRRRQRARIEPQRRPECNAHQEPGRSS